MRLRCTRTQRRPTRRSNRIVTRGVAGAIVPLTSTATRRRTRAVPMAIVRLGVTVTATGADSSRPRAASPANTARTGRCGGG